MYYKYTAVISAVMTHVRRDSTKLKGYPQSLCTKAESIIIMEGLLLLCYYNDSRFLSIHKYFNIKPSFNILVQCGIGSVQILCKMIGKLVLVIFILMALEQAIATSKLQPDNVTASLSCPPGFVSQGNSCVCAEWPKSIVTCDEDALKAYMQIGYCMTYDNLTGGIMAGTCPSGYYRCDSYKFYYPLPSISL